MFGKPTNSNKPYKNMQFFEYNNIFKGKLQDRRDMERNYINYPGDTHFYINLENKEYRVKVSIKDTYRAEEIIKQFKNDRKEQIEAWKKEWKEGVA